VARALRRDRGILHTLSLIHYHHPCVSNQATPHFSTETAALNHGDWNRAIAEWEPSAVDIRPRIPSAGGTEVGGNVKAYSPIRVANIVEISDGRSVSQAISKFRDPLSRYRSMNEVGIIM